MSPIKREFLVNSVIRELKKQRYVVCLSAERSGLSTMLKQVGGQLSEMPSEYHYSLIDVGRLNKLERDGFDKLFKHTLCRSDQALAVHLTRGDDAFTCFQDLSGNAPFSTVIALDNFHILPISAQQSFLTVCRRFYTEKHDEPLYGKVLFVIGGNINLRICEPEETSPFNIAQKIYPAEFDFSAAETMEYLRQIEDSNGRYIDNIVKNYIFDLTGGQIHFLEIFGNKLQKPLEKFKPPEVSLEDVDEIFDAAIKDKDAYLSGLVKGIKGLLPETKIILAEILSGKKHKFSRVDDCVAQLELLGLVKEKQQFAELRSPLMELCIRECGKQFSNIVVPSNLIMVKVIGGNAWAYSTLFDLENDIRNFITSGLYSKYKTAWMDHLPKTNGWNQTKNRHKKNTMDAWRGPTKFPVLAYSFFPNLKEAIDNNWDIFCDYFQPSDKFSTYFERLEEIRNEVAHNRQLSGQSLQELRNIQNAFRNCMVTR